MDKEYLIKLTTNLYQLTLLFPKKEPLRYKMRELADEILVDSLRITNQNEYTNKTENRSPSILGLLEILDSFFEVAKNQNWVGPPEILNLQQEYSKLKEDLKKLFETKTQKAEKELKITRVGPVQIPEGTPDYNPPAALPQAGPSIGSLPVSILEGKGGVNERQKKILEILKEKEKAQVGELKEIFPDVTKRTLRRDFRQLLKDGKIERIGERNDTYYRLGSRT